MDYQALRTYIDATPELAALPNTWDGAYAVAVEINKIADPAYIVWRTNVPVQDIFDSIAWANMTPAAVPDDTNIWQNRNLQCQSKQLALQTILMGRDQINAARTNIRAGLQDALTSLPSKLDGTNQTAGWTAVLANCKRSAKIGEMLLAVGAGTDASPSTMTHEGDIAYQDIYMARQ